MAAKTKMVRVKMMALAAGPAGSHEAGKEYEIAADIAKGYIDGGYARLVVDPAAQAKAEADAKAEAEAKAEADAKAEAEAKAKDKK